MSCMRNLSLRPALMLVPPTRIATVLNVMKWDVTANYHWATVMVTTCQVMAQVHVSTEEMGATKCISRYLDAMVCSMETKIVLTLLQSTCYVTKEAEVATIFSIPMNLIIRMFLILTWTAVIDCFI